MRQNIIILICTVLLLAGCNSQPTRISFRGEAQGTYYSISYYDESGRDFQHQVDSLLDQFDLTASLWVDSSLIRRVNSNRDTIVNYLFADLLKKSIDIQNYTQGSFNCCVGPLVNLYGFGFKNRADVTQEQVDSILMHIQSPQFSLNADPEGQWSIVHKDPLVEFDFNAIAQGYAVDLIAHMFDSLGLTSYIVDVGGEVIAKGKKPNGESWSVGIERPAIDKYSQQEVELVIRLDDKSVVTSGNYRKYYEKEGVRYSHTIDPFTGRPVSHSLLSVSVVSRQSWKADAMATAFMVMGKDRALEFIHAHPDDPDIQAVFFIYDQAGQYRTYATPEFQKLIKK